MQIKGCVALVTGATRGLGNALALALLAAGARKVYAGARDPAAISDPRLQAIQLDITNEADVAGATSACPDVNLLINNAGIASFTPLVAAPSVEAARAEMETNYFGTLAMCRAFAPILGRNGGGALVNILSVASWVNFPMQGSYCTSKAAELSLTNGIRFELKAQNTLVIAVHAGYIETDMTAHLVGVAKSRPEDIADRTVAGIELGLEEILTDNRAEQLKAALASDPVGVARNVQRLWDESRMPPHR
jgi:NAD(P)-dependent dehydrogenase (short-subunit alcohol dehydrogenase family)